MEDASYFSVYGFGTLKIYMLINTKLEKNLGCSGNILSFTKTSLETIFFINAVPHSIC